MGNTLKYLAITAIAATSMASCKNGNGNEGANQKTDTVLAQPMSAIKLESVTASPTYENASIAIKSVKAEKAGKDSAKVAFAFDVQNYELKMQTTDKDNKMCNNSDKGQHIHFILDNQPYKALYEPNNDVTLANGTEHYLMAFLSRSYHESLKQKGAALVYHFKIDEKGNLKKLDDPKTPMVFYSRPKGDYIGKDTTNVLLDYYVWNCELATDGYKVKATITRPQSDAFTTNLDKWEPKFIQNLSGKCKVVLQLIGKDGNKVDGPQTEVSRDINLSAGEPLKKN